MTNVQFKSITIYGLMYHFPIWGSSYLFQMSRLHSLTVQYFDRFRREQNCFRAAPKGRKSILN